MTEPLAKHSPCPTYFEYIASLLGFLNRPVNYPRCVHPAQPGHSALHCFPEFYLQTKDNSLAKFETFSSSLSLLLASKAELPIDHGQGKIDQQRHSARGLPLPVMAAEGFLPDADVKLLSGKGQWFISAGSGEDRENRSVGSTHAIKQFKMIHQKQANNFRHVNRNRLVGAKSEWLRYPDSKGFSIQALIALDAGNIGRSTSINQTRVMTSPLPQTTPCVFVSPAG